MLPVIPSSVITTAAGLMNDAQQFEYTNEVCLPMLNLALSVLQENFELNNIPVTNNSSIPILVKAGVFRIGFDTVPSLPSDLVEIQQLWESPNINQQAWIPMDKQEFLPHYFNNNTLTQQFLVWAWIKGRIHVIPANQDNQIKLDYIASMFAPVTISTIGVGLPFVNIGTYLDFKTAAFCAMYIAENESRAISLNGEANDALSRSMGISVKGTQTIMTRRRPFRASYKRRGTTY